MINYHIISAAVKTVKTYTSPSSFVRKNWLCKKKPGKTSLIHVIISEVFLKLSETTSWFESFQSIFRREDTGPQFFSCIWFSMSWICRNRYCSSISYSPTLFHSAFLKRINFLSSTQKMSFWILIFQFTYFSVVPETPSHPTTVNNQPDSGAVQVVPETQMTCPTVQSCSGEQSSQPAMVHLIQVHVISFTLLLFQ